MCYKQSQHSLQLTLSKLQNWKLITNSNITANAFKLPKQ